jgi:hypothetical protein
MALSQENRVQAGRPDVDAAVQLAAEIALSQREVPVQSRRVNARSLSGCSDRRAAIRLRARAGAGHRLRGFRSLSRFSARPGRHPGLAAAIVDANGIVWERAYGRQNVAGSIATRTDTPFNADG